MKLSVALCSFNGERYLGEQLAGIRCQSRLPDELVIRDDCSSDRTLAVINQFTHDAPFPVRIETSDRNLGTTANFEKAIGLCTGDVVVLADQDDVWLPHKLFALEESLATEPEAGFAFSNAEIVDERLRPLGYTLWEAIDFDDVEQAQFLGGNAFEALLKRYRVTGATIAFRTRYREFVLPIPREWNHDAWIALLLSSVAPCSLIPQPLIQYRQHDQQQLGGRKRGLLKQYRTAQSRNQQTFEAVALCYRYARERLRLFPGIDPGRLTLLDQKIAHCHQRMAMRSPGQRRLPLVLQECWRGHYGRFSRGWKSIAQDLLLS